MDDCIVVDMTAAQSHIVSDELFDVIHPDNHDIVTGQEYRHIVHRTGLLHRAVYCWVFDKEGLLLLQQRSPAKKIGASQWDLSLAEHLQPGESYREAVIRGLREELGIDMESMLAMSNATTNSLRRISDEHQRELHGIDSQGNEFHDVELVQSWKLELCVSYEDVSLSFDDGEVVDVRWIDPKELCGLVETNKETCTAWLCAEAAYLDLFTN